MTYTREQVEQVVEGVVREADSAATVPEVSDVDEAYANGRMDGAREVLRRLDALPNPLTPENLPGVCGGCGVGGAVCSQCRKESQLSYWVGDGAESHVTPEALAAVDESRNPPAAPDGSTRSTCSTCGEQPRAAGLSVCETCARGIYGQHRTHAMPNVETPLTPEQRDAMNTLIQASPLGQRPRATTPTPEVPALAQPVPTAREVVWTGDGVRVLADGTCEEEWPVPRGWAVVTDDRAMVSLARALAEAKRGLEGMRGERDAEREIAQEWEAKVHEAVNGAGGWRDVLFVETKLKERASRAGAESMRKRAKALIMAEQTKQEDGPLSDDNGHAFRLLLRLADAVGALPLEEP